MPEGDTIFQAARALDRALAGAIITAARTRSPQPRRVGIDRLVGRRVVGAESRGKHLLLWFERDVALHTHLRMTGSWHIYEPGQRWRKPEHLARVVLETATAVAVCFAAPVVELLTRDQVARHAVLAALGPDALDRDTDLAQAARSSGSTSLPPGRILDPASQDRGEARRRLDLLGDIAVGEALLDQRVLAGVGNIYRCEACFLERVDPWTPVSEIPEATRDALLATAARLLKASIERGGRGRLSVYGRGGRPCRRCGGGIAVARLGQRWCWWCPRCQGPGRH